VLLVQLVLSVPLAQQARTERTEQLDRKVRQDLLALSVPRVQLARQGRMGLTARSGHKVRWAL